jgi:nucleoside-diphosphate-sugar epimerase
MRAFVFGATGYVGSHVARHLRDAGYAVSGLARSNEAAESLRSAGIVPKTGDLEDLASSVALIEEAETILFCPQLALQPEHAVVRALLDSLTDSGKTFIFTSGTGVLAQRTDGAWSEDSFAEEDPFVPSKYVGFRCETERMVRAAAERGVRSMVIRPPLIWGNGPNNVIKAIYESARKTGAVCYMGAGLNLYSNVHVDDLAEIYRLAIEKGVAGALYHAVSGEENYRSMAECAARTMKIGTRSIGFGEAQTLWGNFLALIAFAMCSRSRSPRSRLELGWQPRPGRLDILEEVSNPAFRS